MNDEVPHFHRDCVEISFELKKKNAASAHLSQLLWGSGTLWLSHIPACNNQRSLSSCPKSSLTGCPLACDGGGPYPQSSLAGSCVLPRHLLRMGNYPVTWSATVQMEARLGEGKAALNSSPPPRRLPLPPRWEFGYPQHVVCI